jgi:hypothetical protein
MEVHMKLPKFIRSIIKCTDTESSRYALGGVKCSFDGDTSTCVATDGRKLVAVSYHDDTGGESFDGIIDGKALAKAVGAVTNGKSGWASVSHDNGAARVTGHEFKKPNGLIAAAPLVEGRFPQHEKVFGIYDAPPADYCCVKLDPVLLKELLDVYSSAQIESNRGVYVWVNREDAVTKPVYMHMHGGEGELVRAVLMPLAPDDGATGQRVCKAYPKPGERTVYETNSPKQEVEEGGPPEVMDDEVIAATVAEEPEPVGAGASSWIPAVS